MKVTYTFSLFSVSTNYISHYPVWKGGRAAGSPFVLKGRIHYPEETIMYPFLLPGLGYLYSNTTRVLQYVPNLTSGDGSLLDELNSCVQLVIVCVTGHLLFQADPNHHVVLLREVWVIAIAHPVLSKWTQQLSRYYNFYDYNVCVSNF